MVVIDLKMRTEIVNSLGTNFHLWRFAFFFFKPTFLRVGKGELQDICENIAFVCKGIFK